MADKIIIIIIHMNTLTDYIIPYRAVTDKHAWQYIRFDIFSKALCNDDYRIIVLLYSIIYI